MKTFESIYNSIYIEASTLLVEIKSAREEIIQLMRDYYVYDKLKLQKEKISVDYKIRELEQLIFDKNKKLNEIQTKINKLPKHYRNKLQIIWKDKRK